MNEQLRNRIIECKNVGVHDNIPAELTTAQEEAVLRLRYNYIGRVRCGSTCTHLENIRENNPSNSMDFDDLCCYFCTQNVGKACNAACDDRPESCDSAEIHNDSGIGRRPSYRALYLDEIGHFECANCEYEGALQYAIDVGDGLICDQCYEGEPDDQ